MQAELRTLVCSEVSIMGAVLLKGSSRIRSREAHVISHQVEARLSVTIGNLLPELGHYHMHHVRSSSETHLDLAEQRETE